MIRSLRPVALAAAATLAIAACSPAGSDEPAGSGDPTTPAAGEQTDAAAGGAETWPRTVTVGDREVEVVAAPERIVALSTETGDLALELVGHERVAAVASGSVTEGAGNAIEEATQVETILPPGTTPDPEQILSLEPDLVLMTSRHDGEEAAADVLAESGIPTLVFASEAFSSPDAVAASVRLLGEALGAEEVAEERAAALESQVAEIEAAVEGSAASPRVLALMSRGDSVMITGIGSTLTTLAELAGGSPVAVEEGWQGTVPADPELVVATAPDVILVEEFRGSGLEPFEGLLSSEALAQVPAIANDQVHVIPSAIASGSAGLRLGDGLAMIAEVLHPDAF